MRTTLTLDDDVAAQLADLTHRLRKPFKTVVNDTLRRGLGRPKPAQRKPFKVVPFSLGGLRPGYDPTKFLQYIGDLEDEAILEKMKKYEANRRR